MRFLSFRSEMLGSPHSGRESLRLVYFTPNDVLVPRVDRQCIMRFCEAMAKRRVEVEVVSLNVRLDYDEPTRTRDLWDVYGLSARFTVVILPCWARQSRSGHRRLAAWRALAYGTYAARLLLGARGVARRQGVVFYFKNYLIGIPLLLVRSVLRRRPILLFEMHTPPHHFLARRLIKYFDGIIPVSHILANELKTAYAVTESKLLVAHQGVDLAFVESRRLDKADARRLVRLPVDKKLVIYTGKVHGSDGEIDLLLDAARSFRRDVDLVIVGGREDQVDRIRSRLTTESVTNVHMVGFVAPADVFVYQMAADVLVTYYPSAIPLNRYRASPGKLFEYMASGRPIVTADLPALREALSPTAALFVEPDNPHRLAQAIETVLRDDVLAASLAARAYADVQEFTWEKRAGRVCDFVDRLASQRVANGAR